MNLPTRNLRYAPLPSQRRLPDLWHLDADMDRLAGAGLHPGCGAAGAWHLGHAPDPSLHLAQLPVSPPAHSAFSTPLEFLACIARLRALSGRASVESFLPAAMPKGKFAA